MEETFHNIFRKGNEMQHDTLSSSSKQSWEHSIPALRAEGKGVACSEITSQFFGYNLDPVKGDSR